MIDQVQLLIDLSSLTAEATQRGDDRAVGILRQAIQAVVDWQSDARALASRRERDKERKREGRMSAESAESTESADRTQMRSSSTSLSRSLTENDYSAERLVRGIHGTEIDEAIQRLLDLLRGAMGDVLFPAADEFIRRRPYRTWKGWLDEMLTLLGPGSQYNPADMARVCKDDAALDRPIGSPRGLRSFLLNARSERLSPKAKQDPDAEPLAGEYVAKIRALVKQNPGRGQYIDKREVLALGDDVARAYDAVGGAQRFVNVPSQDLPFLLNAFEKAMRGAA